MERAAGAGNAGRRWRQASGCCAALLACVLAPSAHAQDPEQGGPEIRVTEARAEQPLRMQVQATSLPRFDQDGGFQGPRVDFSLTPLNANGSGLGAVLSMANPAAGSPGLGMQGRTAVDFGVRWTQRLQSQRQVDVTAWRRLSNPDDAYSMVQMRQPVYGARLEMNLSAKSRKSGLAIERGFVGFQMESGARITIKRKDGRPMVYYRTAF